MFFINRPSRVLVFICRVQFLNVIFVMVVFESINVSNKIFVVVAVLNDDMENSAQNEISC